MSTPTGFKPRHDRDGQYQVECAHCGVLFRTNNPRTRYCTYKHKSDAQNKRFYGRHKKEIIRAVIIRRLRKRIATSTTGRKVKAVAKAKSFDEMSESEILEYIRKNPGQVRAAK